MRKMASIRKISNILSIEGADAVECAVVDAWNVVVKKDEFKVDDLVVYCEIDSWVPNNIAPFLTKDGHFPKEYLGVKGERLKTKKIRGVVSQGLILPLDILTVEYEGNLGLGWFDEGEDVSEVLGIVKYEPPVPAQLAGLAKGNFPRLVPKTDEERIQNLSKDWDKYQEHYSYEVTEKLDGSSCTFYLDNEGNFEVCSRNLSLKESDTNSFWKAAKMYSIEEKMKKAELFGFAIQGELVGEGIQGNSYNVKGVDFYCYTIWDSNTQKYLTPEERIKIADNLGIKHVPVIHKFEFLQDKSIQNVLAEAEGKSILNPKKEMEGLVFKCNENPTMHFKAISNKWLLKGGE